MTLYDVCLKALKENPDIEEFIFEGHSFRPLNTKKHKACINDLAKAYETEGEFEYKVVDEEYIDEDGEDDEGRPIRWKRTVKECKVNAKVVR